MRKTITSYSVSYDHNELNKQLYIEADSGDKTASITVVDAGEALTFDFDLSNLRLLADDIESIMVALS